jgi:hypothetical protein
MSELNLLLCGCTISFIAVGGAYVYLREAFERRERSQEPPARQKEEQKDQMHAA